MRTSSLDLGTGFAHARFRSFLALLAEDSRLNVYAGELEVRPPARQLHWLSISEIAHLSEFRPHSVRANLHPYMLILYTY
jgi:hypothetical protein